MRVNGTMTCEKEKESIFGKTEIGTKETSKRISSKDTDSIGGPKEITMPENMSRINATEKEN